MIVDSHAHLVPPELIAAVRTERARFPSVRVIDEGGSIALAFAGGKPTRPISKPLSDVAARLAWMDQQGIDTQVCGGWVDMFGYELPAQEGESWSRLINDALLAAAEAQPRFVPLATVPLQDGARAAAVLKAAVAAGAPGAMIGTLPRGIGSVLDAADLDPFWAMADELGAVIHIHPSFDAGDTRAHDFGLANAVGRISDAIVGWRGCCAAGMWAATPTRRSSLRWARPACPSYSAGSSATRRSRAASPTPSRRSAGSMSTPSCTTRGCCNSSSRCWAPTGL
jgi:aminocarboxymuconate-semialdehyde decarboxylase